MKVKLVSYTKDGEKIVAIASKMSRSRKGWDYHEISMTDEEIERDCHKMCVEDITYTVHNSFGMVIYMLDRTLQKYGIRVVYEMCEWEGYERWCKIEVGV